MKEISYIHAANLCLDAPFKELANAERGKRLQHLLVSAPTKTLERLIDLCLDEKVDFLILGGDLLNQSPTDPKLRSQIAKALKKLADENISVFLAHPVSDKLLFATLKQEIRNIFTFPANSPETFQAMRQEECVALVQGMAPPAGRGAAEALALFKNNPQTECFQLAVTPFEIVPDNQEKAGSCPVSSLLQTGFDAIAPAYGQPRAIFCEKPLVASPGPLISREPDSPGPHGCLLVHARKDETWKCECEFINLAPVIFQDIYLILNRNQTAEQLKAELINSLKNIQSSLGATYTTIIATCHLTGSTDLNPWLRSEEFQKEIHEIFGHFGNGNPSIALHDFLIETECAQNCLQRNDLVGEIFRIGNDLLADQASMAAFTADALSRLPGHPELEQIVQALNARERARLLSNSMHLCQRILEDN